MAPIWTIDEGINYVAAQDFFVFNWSIQLDFFTHTYFIYQIYTSTLEICEVKKSVQNSLKNK